MAEVQGDRKYHKGHGWVVVESNQTARFGVTNFTQEKLNDVLMVVLPQVGDKVTKGVPMGRSSLPKIISDLVRLQQAKSSRSTRLSRRIPRWSTKGHTIAVGWLRCC